MLNATPGLVAGGEARIVVQGLREANPVRKTYTVRLDAPAVGRILSFPYLIPAGELEPDYYEISVVLAGPDGEVLDEKTDTLTVSPAAAIGHPIANAKGIPVANQFLFRYMIGEQLEKTGRAAAAAAFYEEAFRSRPEYAEGVVRYANFLIRTGAFDRALEIAETLRTGREAPVRLPRHPRPGPVRPGEVRRGPGRAAPGQQALQQRDGRSQLPREMLLEAGQEDGGLGRFHRLPEAQSRPARDRQNGRGT